MKVIKRSLIAFLSFLAISLPGSGQEGLFFSDPTAHKVELPFSVSQNLIIIPVYINGVGPLNMVLDSGINHTIITELSGIELLELKFAREVFLNGLGSGEPGKAFASSGNQIRIEDPNNPGTGINGIAHQVYLMAEDHFSLSRQLGMQVNGLIGAQFFTDFIVEINYPKKTLTFYDPERFEFKRKYRRYRELPVSVIGSKAFIAAELEQADQSSVPLRLMIDTGASLPVWLAVHTDSRIQIPEETIPALLGQGLNGSIGGVNGRGKMLTLAAYQLKNPLISFPDSVSVSGIIGNNGRNGSLGNDILRRFHLLFDYQNERIFLKPNRDFSDPFSYNKSGMEIEKPMLGLPLYTVYDVVANSPAALAGVLAGDQLTGINHQLTKDMSLDEINSFLHGNHGNRVRITINRNGEEKKLRFRLHADI